MMRQYLTLRSSHLSQLHVFFGIRIEHHTTHVHCFRYTFKFAAIATTFNYCSTFVDTTVVTIFMIFPIYTMQFIFIALTITRVVPIAALSLLCDHAVACNVADVIQVSCKALPIVVALSSLSRVRLRWKLALTQAESVVQ